MPCNRDDPECLRKAATHVAHDIRMFRDAWRKRSDPLAYNAWFIFCRSLMDFFAATGSKPNDDIYAWHYFDRRETWDAEIARVPKPSTYDQYRDAVNKLAAHLTYSRVDYAATSDIKPSLEVTEYLLSLAALLVRLLPPERAAWFGGLLL